jgi:thiol-disulfide isomerase/thioredoxin
VLLYWGAKWCPPCNQLKATLFNRADFIQQSQALLPVLIDGDLPGAQKLGTRFSVRGYPTLILFNPDGKEVTRLPGEADAPRVIQLLQLGLSGGRPIQAVLRDAQAGKALKPAEWQLLSYYSWETDQDQLVKASGRAALLQQLAQAKGVPEPARTGWRSRPWLTVPRPAPAMPRCSSACWPTPGWRAPTSTCWAISPPSWSRPCTSRPRPSARRCASASTSCWRSSRPT